MATIERINLEVTTNAKEAAAGIDALSAALTRLKDATGTSATGLQHLNTELKNLKVGNRSLAALNRNLERLDKTKGAAASVAVPQIPTQTITTPQVDAGRVRSATSAFSRFAVVMGTVAASIYATQRAFEILGWVFDNTIRLYSDLIEALNLFTVAMKGQIGVANQFIGRLTEGLGLDPRQLMEYQGVFFQITSSMGIATDKAYMMSEGLTQLVFDFASLRNLRIEDVFTKLKGAIVGEARAMRELGIDITQAALQETAHALGIEKKVKVMTQAEKAQLRYITIMARSGDAQGDMARTLNQPANMMRVLASQVSQAGRALGALFIPVLQAVLPYLIALAYWARIGLESLAALAGIKLPEITPSSGSMGDFADSADAANNSLGGAADNAKKLRDYVMGIDELNIINPTDPSAGGGAGGAGGGGGVADIEIPNVYDMFKDATAPFQKIIDGVRESIQFMLDALEPFIDALVRLWKAILPFVGDFWSGFALFYTDVLAPMAAWALNNLVAPVLENLASIIETFNENPDWTKFLGFLTGMAVTLAVGGALYSAIGPGGWLLVAFAAGFTIGSWFVGATDFENEVTLFLDNIEKLKNGTTTITPTDLKIALNVIPEFYGIDPEKFWSTLKVLIPAAPITDMWVKFTIKPAFEWYDGLETIQKDLLKFIATFVLGLVVPPVRVVQAIKLALEWTTPQADPGGGGTTTPLENSTIVVTVKGAFTESFRKVQKAWEGMKSKALSLSLNVRSFGLSSLNRLIQGYNRAAAAMANFTKVTLPVFRDMNGLYGIPHSTRYVRFMARGGMAATGSMFVAGEAGPELIGSFGGNSNTVMPLENSGFVEAMASAVYGAVVSAMGTSQGGGGGDIYMDAEKVGEVIRKAEQRAGARMGLVRSVTA